MSTSQGLRTLSATLAAASVMALAPLVHADEPLSNPVQITFPDKFLRAGEAYFNPDATWIIFQAIPRPPADAAPSTVYSMYVARLRRDGDGRVSGIEEPILISPAESANTCGYFHPLEPYRVIFGSTLTRPSAEAPAGYQRGTSTYAWQFPTEMEVITRVVPQIYYEKNPKLTTDIDWPEKESEPTPIWSRKGYDAECSYSPNARHIVYTRVDPETLDPDIYVYDTKTKTHRPLVVHKGYDGGPFFSPDGSLICYRSDRKGNDLLQLYIAELTFSDDGQVLGVKREAQVTDNEHVNWAPFWHPSGEYLLYTTSEQGHRNYEIYSIEVPIGIRQGVLPADLKKRRITSSDGFDGLPAFSAAGDLLMWTSQRGPKRADEDRPSSQLWIARPGDLAP
jgi:TolB protein